MAKTQESTKRAPDEAEGPVWLFWGQDEFFISRQARALVDRLCPPDQQALGLETIEGRADKSSEVAIRALQRCRSGVATMGFFGASKTVWLRDADFFNEGFVGRQVAVKAEVAKLVEELKRGLPPGQRLVISAAKVDKRSAFYKTCLSTGEVQELSAPEKPSERERYFRDVVQDLLKEVGLRAEGGAAEFLLAKVGTDTRQLFKEIEKLSIYAGARKTITEEDVRLIVSSTRESAGWDLADAMGDRDLSRTLETLRQLLFQGEKEFLLIMGLQSRIRELLIYRTCLDQRWIRVSGSAPWLKAEWQGAGDAESLLESLPEKLHPAKVNPWRAGRLGAQARHYTRAELVRAQGILLATHEAMIHTSTPSDLLLELGLIKIIAKPSHEN
ncbi:MAG TPA: DNA polymerase III subunit delta [Kiritimatiellia bacterium]|nr:DNA polymerase III subunit delta [Kiritimatiellia bacterium]